MKKYKTFCLIFAATAVISLCAGCALVGFNYAAILNATVHGETSAPPYVAFLLGIPFIVGTALFLALSFICHKKYKRM